MTEGNDPATADSPKGRRLIEVNFPIRAVSEHSAQEKYKRRGNISSVHVWWARRPLAASRATTYASLVRAPAHEKERQEGSDFIEKLCQWENSLNEGVIDRARKDILEANGGESPRVLDCFAGGGAIPLEALRLGCESHALELNPVSVLILKATLEYPQKYGTPEVVSKLRPPRPQANEGGQLGLKGGDAKSPVLEDDVRLWGKWTLEEARKDVGSFYPSEPDGSIPVGYLWARTVRCQNPDCGAEIPLMRHYWLARKPKKKVALRPIVDHGRKQVDFEVVEGGEISFEPAAGTVRRAKVTCLVCGAGMDDKTLRREFREGRAGQRMNAVVLHNPKRKGKTYRIATQADLEVFSRAEAALRDSLARADDRGEFSQLDSGNKGLSLVPDEPITMTGRGQITTPLFGMVSFRDLFNVRQQLAVVTFVEKVRQAHQRMLSEGYEPEYAKALVTYLALCVDKVASFCSSNCTWKVSSEQVINAFAGRQVLQFVSDYFELNPISGVSTSWENSLEVMLEGLAVVPHSSAPAAIRQGTATRLPFPDAHFDAVVTDPPYYDNVPYAALSDFFYVWLKRSVGDLYPRLFATPLTPKSEEIVQDPARHGARKEIARGFFDEKLTQAFEEIHRVLKPHGAAVIVFAHKSTDAWETVIQSLIDSGLVLNASWPVHTEMKARLTAQKTASLASSIYMVCRKRVEERVAYFNEIQPAIEQRIREKLEQFWNEGIGGADFFISAIGPAVEVFGRYSRVERLSGEEVTARELLEHVRRAVSEFALERILKSPQLGGVDTETRFYLLWRWTYNNLRAPFDEARKLSQAVGLELSEHWDTGGFVRRDKEYIRVLGPEARAKHLLDGRGNVGPESPIVDVLHKCLLLWQKNDRKAIEELLRSTRYGGRDIFRRVAQSISDVLPEGDEERRLLQGFLYGLERYERSMDVKQPALFEAEGGPTEGGV